MHVIGPELGLTQPGMTVVCGDSHTATHGAFGALAFGIGTSEVEHVLATQCLLQRKSKTFQVQVDGALQPGVTAKDIVLALIARIGVGGGTGVHLRISRLGHPRAQHGRAHDCLQYVHRRRRARRHDRARRRHLRISGRTSHAPKGADWDAAAGTLEAVPTDEGAAFDRSLAIDADALEPMITYGTNPGMGMSITAPLPEPSQSPIRCERESVAKALRYMGLEGGKPLLGHPIECRIHRKLHQFAHQRSARRGRHC